MKFWEAAKALQEGKKVRGVEWWGCMLIKFLILTFCFPMQAFKVEWELYEEPVKTYSFAEALVLMKEGIKLRRPHFREYSAVCIGKWGRIRWCSGDNFPISIQDIEADDWTIIL
jgi:hypothetical protein